MTSKSLIKNPRDKGIKGNREKKKETEEIERGLMAKSDEFPIAAPSHSRDYDINPFNDLTAFSPPQTNFLDRVTTLRGGGGVENGENKHSEIVGERGRSFSQPAPIKLRDPTEPPFPPRYVPLPFDGVAPLPLSPNERGNSDPNLTTMMKLPDTPVMHPLDRAQSTPIRDAVEAEWLRGFHSAPVTPCQTPIGSQPGSPKAGRKAGGGLLGAIFGAGIYGRQTSDGPKPGLLGHLAEDNEDDLTPVGSPSGFTIDELKTKLRGVDDRASCSKDVLDPSPISLGAGGGGSGGFLSPMAAANANKTKPKKKKEKEAELQSYRELTFITPSSM